MMVLDLITPSARLVERGVRKIILRGPSGYFCLLPRHIDFASTVVPGILEYEVEDGSPRTVAVDEGLLVKKGAEVAVSVRSAVPVGRLEDAELALRERIRSLGAEDREARAALARLEARFASLTARLR